MASEIDTLVILPTRGRPEGAARLIRSIWRNQAEPTETWLTVNEDDVRKYQALAEVLEAETPVGSDLFLFVVPDDLAYPGKINYAAEVAMKLDGEHAGARQPRYFFIPNDDHEVLTPGFDRIFKDAIGDAPFGLAFGNDGIWTEGQTPTAPFITSSIQQTLGWTALPGLGHILVDNVWLDLAQWCGTSHFLRDVSVQHHHLDNGEAEQDATYAETQNNEARNENDRRVYKQWREDQRWIDGDFLRALWEDEAQIPPRQFQAWE